MKSIVKTINYIIVKVRGYTVPGYNTENCYSIQIRLQLVNSIFIICY